jgi:spore maturation protein CgeB
MRFWQKKILAVIMQWDYGIKDRGLSGEKLWFYDNLQKLVSEVDVFWYDEYLSNINQLQIDLINKVKESNPDLVVFVPYTDQFTIETLDEIKRHCNTYAWYGDDQWRFDSYYSKYAPHFSFVSTTDPWCVSKYREIGVAPILSQWAARSYSENIGPLRENETFLYDVSFVGGHNEFRGWFIKNLARMGIHVECFGAGWPNNRVSFEEMEQIFRRSRINLNISNSVSQDIRFIFGSRCNFMAWLKSSKRAEQVKARHFEIPLAGGFQLTNYVLGIEMHWIIGEQIAVYISPEECAKQIVYYLEREDYRRRIVEKSHERAKREHTYEKRLEEILEEIWG